MKGSLRASAALLLVILCGYSQPGGATGPAGRSREATAPDVAELIRNVRKSIGYEALQSLSRGFTVEESAIDANTAAGFVYSFGPNGKTPI